MNKDSQVFMRLLVLLNSVMEQETELPPSVFHLKPMPIKEKVISRIEDHLPILIHTLSLQLLLILVVSMNLNQKLTSSSAITVPGENGTQLLKFQESLNSEFKAKCLTLNSDDAKVIFQINLNNDATYMNYFYFRFL